MNKKNICPAKRLNVAASLLLLMITTAVQADGQYRISWYTIDGGGGACSGGRYVLTGTIGQPDTDWSKAGNYEVLGGFWPGGLSCLVQFDDFGRFADYWLAYDLTADLDDDKDLDFADLRWLADYWLCSCPYAWPLK